ncbi:efflux RND transporter periplasmic adaptor subunit [Sphingomonas tabacisoli]|uniref:Efflux RND transporter periplasmic adaptor subunit n=1 Tax=Sphingomonas tabacisoli TaxID=2249466 RepID=A0ABW4I1V3_9SPHN
MNSEAPNPREPVSGGAMDKVVERRGLSNKVKAGIAAGALGLAAIGFYAYAPSGNSQTVAADRVTISTVQRGTFDDFLPLRARVTPLLTIYLDSVEGGRIEEKLVEDGATVQKGQLLAVLSNPELQLSVLARQTDVSRELNSMRSQELALAQTRLADERGMYEAKAALDKAERQHAREAALAARGFIARKQFDDTTADLEYQRGRYAVQQRTRSTDERLQTSQLAQLRQSAASMNSSLDVARLNLESLKLRAPVSGQLSGFEIMVGQSVNRGERIGQIDSPGANKLIAGVDEFYLGRVQVGQKAVIDQGGKTYQLKVTKIYPQVRNGQFEVDLQFQGGEPQGLQRGQTLQAKLTLGDPTPAMLIPNGSFYNDTGGAWVFVVTPDGGKAVKRNVRLGRRNADFIEVLDGLQPGEKVLTSPYTGFADKDRLDLQQK